MVATLRNSFSARCAAVVAVAIVSACPPLLAQGQTISVVGEVRAKTKAPIAGATVTFELAGVTVRKGRTNKAGVYAFQNLPPGVYSVHVEARSFQRYELLATRIAGLRSMRLNVTLELAPVKQEIAVVSGDKPLSIETEGSPSTVVLQGAGLTGLPDDPNDFAAAVQALAGPSALGPIEPQLFVNGFLYHQMPPKEAIREIRINDNPFSAENDRPAIDRIEATTKAGGKQVHGEAYFNLDAGWWDARNPFTRPLPPNASHLFGANVAGPISGRASFFLTMEQTGLNFREAVNGTVLNTALAPVPFVQNVADFENRRVFSAQSDVTLNKSNALTARYSSSSYGLPREGVGQTSLPESGYRIASREQTVQVSETAVLTPQMADESKFQFVKTDLASKALTRAPTIAVDKAFTTGSSSSALSSLQQDQWELQNNLSSVHHLNSLHGGIRLRGETAHESLGRNLAGTFSFLPGPGPELALDNTPVRDAQGAISVVPLSALERYRRTLLFEREGLSPSAIRLLGGGASSFSMDNTSPQANVRQYDLGVYLQDDWHVLPNLLLGAGVRYERQTNLRDRSNMGPRVSFTWAPVTAQKDSPHTVVRGGLGLFYDRLDSTLVLQARHSEQPHWHYTTTAPSALDLYPNAPQVSSLAAYATPADTLQIGPRVRAPATLQTTVSVEQELPFKTRLSVSFTQANTFRDLLLVDTAPFQVGSPRSLILDSTGRLTQRQLKLEVSNKLSKRVNLTADYVLNRAGSNTDGTANPAADPTGLSYELGRSAKDIRHNFIVTGAWDMPWGLRLSPFVVASSSRPFNIITGRYEDGDIPYTGRPAFATDPTQPDVIVTRFGAFRLNPSPGQAVIARNFGKGPAFFSASVRLSKTISFGSGSGGEQTAKDTSSAASEHRYSLIVSAQVINLTNHLNPGVPDGSLSSPQFSQASSIAPGFNFGGGAAEYQKQLQASRRMELQLRFTF